MVYDLIRKKIKEARLQKRLNQQALATLINRSQNTLSQWERGSNQCSYDDLESIAKAMSRSSVQFRPSALKNPMKYSVSGIFCLEKN